MASQQRSVQQASLGYPVVVLEYSTHALQTWVLQNRLREGWLLSCKWLPSAAVLLCTFHRGSNALVSSSLQLASPPPLPLLHRCIASTALGSPATFLVTFKRNPLLAVQSSSAVAHLAAQPCSTPGSGGKQTLIALMAGLAPNEQRQALLGGSEAAGGDAEAGGWAAVAPAAPREGPSVAELVRSSPDTVISTLQRSGVQLVAEFSVPVRASEAAALAAAAQPSARFPSCAAAAGPSHSLPPLPVGTILLLFC